MDEYSTDSTINFLFFSIVFFLFVSGHSNITGNEWYPTSLLPVSDELSEGHIRWLHRRHLCWSKSTVEMGGGHFVITVEI